MILLLTHFFLLNIKIVSTVKSGSYVSVHYGMRECENMTKPYTKNPLVFHGELYNVSDHVYFRGSLTLYQEQYRNVLVRGRLYRREDTEWKIVKIMNSHGCEGLIASTAMFLFNIKYNKKTCLLPKGHYSFDKIDMNKLEHMWSSYREYGRFLWIIEAITPQGTLTCWQYETLVTPLKLTPSKKTRS